jgi:hypothetical protein
LEEPLGWAWEEKFTGVNMAKQVASAGAAKSAPPADEKALTLKKPPPKRPPPKL